MADYPRGPMIEPETPSKAGRLGIDCSILGCSLVFGGLLICAGLMQLLAEGPHGPNGEITNDPSIKWLLPLLCGAGLLVIVLGIAAVYARNRKS
jgi:hypothetical protein